jgi:hypothetical protein
MFYRVSRSQETSLRNTNAAALKVWAVPSSETSDIQLLHGAETHRQTFVS